MGENTKEKFAWDSIFDAVRLCRAAEGDKEPTRLAVEQVLGGGDGNRIKVAIRAVEAEYGLRPEIIDSLPPHLKRFIADPRLPGGRLPIPAQLKATLPEPYLSAMITMSSATLQVLEDAATNAAILVADKEQAADTRVAEAEQRVKDCVAVIAVRDAMIADLGMQLATATRRADKAEAARDAYKESKRGISGMQAQVREVHTAVVKKRVAPARTKPRQGTARPR